MNSKPRAIMVSGFKNEPEKRAVFHGFFESKDENIANPVAVVEYENGKVETVDAYRVRFVYPTAGGIE